MTDSGGRMAARARRRHSGGGSRSPRARTAEEILAAEQAIVQDRWRAARAIVTHVPFNAAAFATSLAVHGHDLVAKPAAIIANSGSATAALASFAVATVAAGIYGLDRTSKLLSWKAATALALLGAVGGNIAASQMPEEPQTAIEAPRAPAP